MRSLGWKWPLKLGPGLGRIGLVAEHQAVHLGLLDDRAAAMIGDARIVIAGDPGPARRRGQARSAGRAPSAGRRSQPWRSWKLSPRHQISAAPGRGARSRRDRRASRSNRRAAASARSWRTSSLFRDGDRRPARRARAGQNSAPCGSAISSWPQNEKRTMPRYKAAARPVQGVSRTATLSGDGRGAPRRRAGLALRGPEQQAADEEALEDQREGFCSFFQTFTGLGFLNSRRCDWTRLKGHIPKRGELATESQKPTNPATKTGVRPGRAAAADRLRRPARRCRTACAAPARSAPSAPSSWSLSAKPVTKTIGRPGWQLRAPRGRARRRSSPAWRNRPASGPARPSASAASAASPPSTVSTRWPRLTEHVGEEVAHVGIVVDHQDARAAPAPAAAPPRSASPPASSPTARARRRGSSRRTIVPSPSRLSILSVPPDWRAMP